MDSKKCNYTEICPYVVFKGIKFNLKRIKTSNPLILFLFGDYFSKNKIHIRMDKPYIYYGKEYGKDKKLRKNGFLIGKHNLKFGINNNEEECQKEQQEWLEAIEKYGVFTCNHNYKEYKEKILPILKNNEIMAI